MIAEIASQGDLLRVHFYLTESEIDLPAWSTLSVYRGKNPLLIAGC